MKLSSFWLSKQPGYNRTLCIGYRMLVSLVRQEFLNILDRLLLCVARSVVDTGDARQAELPCSLTISSCSRPGDDPIPVSAPVNVFCIRLLVCLSASDHLQSCLVERGSHDLLRLLKDQLEMVCAAKTLGVDLVDVFGA